MPARMTTVFSSQGHGAKPVRGQVEYLQIFCTDGIVKNTILSSGKGALKVIPTKLFSSRITENLYDFSNFLRLNSYVLGSCSN